MLASTDKRLAGDLKVRRLARIRTMIKGERADRGEVVAEEVGSTAVRQPKLLLQCRHGRRMKRDEHLDFRLAPTFPRCLHLAQFSQQGRGTIRSITWLRRQTRPKNVSYVRRKIELWPSRGYLVSELCD